MPDSKKNSHTQKKPASGKGLGKGLGRGLSALIPQDFNPALLAEETERVQKVPINRVHPSSDQPRTVFDDTALGELAASIRRYGIMQPLVVSPRGDDYVIIAGERRWRAAQLAKCTTVPVLVRTAAEQERLELALVENVQRVDLSPLEQAVSIEYLHQQFNLSYQDVAARLGKAETTVSNIVRLLQLPDEARAALAGRHISEGHARQILALKHHPEKQQRLLELIMAQGWSVRQAEHYVGAVKRGEAEQPVAEKKAPEVTPEAQRLTQRYGAPVAIRRTAKGGRIELSFKSDEELAKLLTLLGE